jgi:septum formation protein
MGVPFDVEPCPLAEPACKPATIAPARWAEALAHFKARAVAESNRGRWVLGADTVVVCAGRLLGKPRDADEARQMLELQAGRATEVISGVCVLRCRDETRRLMGHEVTLVWMRDAPDVRRAYLASGDWLGKAGAYGIQDVGDQLVERVVGSTPNVVGLPLALVEQMLRLAGVHPSPHFQAPDN